MKKVFIINYEIPALFTKSYFSSSIELEDGEPEVIKPFLDACKVLIARKHGCSSTEVELKNISFK